MYALIEFAGKQYQIEDGNSIKVPRIQGKVGSKVHFDKILYLDDGNKKTVGTPLIKGTKIDGEIVSHERGRKVVVFKFKRRKGYQKKNSHRQDYTILKVGKLGVVKKPTASKKTTISASKKAVNKKALTKKVSPKTTPKKTTTKKVAQKKTASTKGNNK